MVVGCSLIGGTVVGSLTWTRSASPGDDGAAPKMDSRMGFAIPSNKAVAGIDDESASGLLSLIIGLDRVMFSRGVYFTVARIYRSLVREITAASR